MKVVCATDDNFVQHCSIMLTSLLVNNSDVQVYVLTEGLKPENEKIIREEIEDKGGIVDFCIVDSSIVEKFPMPGGTGLQHISRATYYRLLISDLLPETIEKVIYLDCDIIVNKSIQQLWDTSLNGYALAAVKQIGFGYEAERLGYPIEYGYFNAGVNMINLTYFREHNVSGQLIKYIADNYSKIKYHDQDTLNAVLYDQTLHIMPQWNMTSIIYAYQLNKRGDRISRGIVNDYKAEKENAFMTKKDPYVVHYVSRPKPWQDNCVHPLYHLYYDYAKRTIHYANIHPQNEFYRQIAVLRHTIRGRLSAIKQLIVHKDKSRI